MSKFNENFVLKMHQISDDGEVTSIRFEFDGMSGETLSKTFLFGEENFSRTTDPSKVCLTVREDSPEELFSCVQYQDVPWDKRSLTFLNIPTMIRCQNCENNFPTKYQFQRHQCEFNADKVVLKPDAELKDVEKGDRVKYECSTCGKFFVSKNNLERHETSHKNALLNTCEHCNKQFVSENRLRIHKENHCKKAGDISKFYRSDVTVWKCKNCHEVFSSAATAGFHIENCRELIGEGLESSIICKQDDGDSSQNIEKILTEILLQCEFCNRTYANKNLLILHTKRHTTEKNYECINCKEIFDSYAVAAQHWMKKCSEFANLFYLPKLTYCEFCDRTFKSHEILYTHKIKKRHYSPKVHVPSLVAKVPQSNENFNKLIEDVLNTLSVPINKLVAGETVGSSMTEQEGCKVPIKCEVQSDGENVPENPTGLVWRKKRGRKRKWPQQATKLKKLSLVVDEGYKYQCERCGNIFDSVMDLENHREDQHAASFNCEECGQVLHSAKALLIHSRAHKSLKPYVCDTCGRSYSQTSHLWQHMRFHQGIKPFACPHEGCEARYTIRPDLKDHIRKVHTRERPFKCSVCNKCFLTGSVYYQHRLIHTNDRRYACDICQKRFFRADALNNHKRIHTDERPYRCNVCGREFRQKGDRNKHFKTQHPEVFEV